MIMITGGLGFIGSHTARALLDLGQSCVLTQRRPARCPEFLAGALGTALHVEQLDVADPEAVLDLGSRYPITGIVHLAAPGADLPDTIDGLRANLIGLLNVLRAAERWSVARVSVASSLAVYQGVTTGPYREELPLRMTPAEPVPVLKKTAELLGSLVAASDDLDVLNLRLSTIWGPLRRLNEPPFSAVPDLVRSGAEATRAAAPVSLDLYRDDGRDLCYVKDCARGIALLQLAGGLRHRTYNVADGRVTTNRDIGGAIGAALPGASIELLPGRDPDGGEPTCLDVSRIHADTGYAPAYSLDPALADYIAWLTAGHEY